MLPKAQELGSTWVRKKKQQNLPNLRNPKASPMAQCKESTCHAGDSGLIPGQEDALEKEMATHSSILAWEVTRTEEPGRLQFMGSQSWT